MAGMSEVVGVKWALGEEEAPDIINPPRIHSYRYSIFSLHD
jgi:hypothetical protein